MRETSSISNHFQRSFTKQAPNEEQYFIPRDGVKHKTFASVFVALRENDLMIFRGQTYRKSKSETL